MQSQVKQELWSLTISNIRQKHCIKNLLYEIHDDITFHKSL